MFLRSATILLHNRQCAITTCAIFISLCRLGNARCEVVICLHRSPSAAPPPPRRLAPILRKKKNRGFLAFCAKRSLTVSVALRPMPTMSRTGSEAPGAIPRLPAQSPPSTGPALPQEDAGAATTAVVRRLQAVTSHAAEYLNAWRLSPLDDSDNEIGASPSIKHTAAVAAEGQLCAVLLTAAGRGPARARCECMTLVASASSLIGCKPIPAAVWYCRPSTRCAPSR
jgi:hypothetical protein